MPVRRRALARVRYELTFEQEWELYLGPTGGQSAFASEEERREAWLGWRDRLVASADVPLGVIWAARRYQGAAA